MYRNVVFFPTVFLLDFCQVAVSGTLCNAAGGTVVNYSGQLRQLCEGPMLEIELRAKMARLTLRHSGVTVGSQGLISL